MIRNDFNINNTFFVLRRDEKRAFRRRVESQFTEWLKETGNKKQVADLAELTKLYERSLSNENA